MKRALLHNIVVVLVCSAFSFAQSGGSLEKVLNEMDRASVNFKSAQANFDWDQYTKVVNEHDTQQGTIYFRRESKGTQMAADITHPDKKYVVFSGNTVQVFQPSMDQITEYNVGKNKSEVESFLVLGFGGSGHELQKSFEVKYDGPETVNGIQTQKLELTPKSKTVAANFSKIILWIDPKEGVSVQQQLISPSGDYRLAKYSNIKLNKNIPSDVFKIKKGPNTKVIKPQTGM